MNAAEQVDRMPEPDFPAMEDAITSIRSLFRRYPKIKAIREGIVPLIGRNNAKTEGPVNLLLGPTRSGKSHLLGNLMRDYPRQEKAIARGNGDFADRIPVVLVRVRKGTPKTIADAIYFQLVGRKPALVLGLRYTEDDVVGEIKRIGAECELGLLVLDEAHQSVTSRTDEGAKEVASFVKDLSNLAVFSILVVGTEKARRLIDADDELQARTTRIFQIKPFAWDRGDVEVWTRILGDFDKALSANVFGTPSGLTEPDMAYALMVAACGLVGHMSTVVECTAKDVVRMMASGERARRNLEAKILWCDLEAMFDQWAPGQGRANPFSEANRPRGDGLPKLGSVPAFEPAEVADEPEAWSLAGGRTRRNARDSIFRK